MKKIIVLLGGILLNNLLLAQTPFNILVTNPVAEDILFGLPITDHRSPISDNNCACFDCHGSYSDRIFFSKNVAGNFFLYIFANHFKKISVIIIKIKQWQKEQPPSNLFSA